MTETRASYKVKPSPINITEAAFQQQIIDLGHMLGYLVTHFRPAKTAKGWRTPISGDKGFVDTVLAKPGRLILAELKSERGRVSPEQQQWINTLRSAGVEVYLWRPSDFDEAAKILQRVPTLNLNTVGEVIGKWPGSETDSQIAEALEAVE